jgi:hypothetical protein
MLVDDGEQKCVWIGLAVVGDSLAGVPPGLARIPERQVAIGELPPISILLSASQDIDGTSGNGDDCD